MVGLAAAHPAPGAVGPLADEGLDDHAHQRGQDPEETELVRVGTERSEDAADIGTLQGIGDLHSEKSEAEIPHLPESELFAWLHASVIDYDGKIKHSFAREKIERDEW